MISKTLYRLRHGVVCLGAACALSACLQNQQDKGDTASTVSAILNMSTPGPLASGRSTIEGRYIYAQPDEGEISFPISLNAASSGELAIADPSMVKGSGSVRFVYSKRQNTVDVFANFHGLPYRPSYTKSFDNSTPLVKHFTTVKDAHWQLWLMGTLFARQRETLYYDATTRQLIGSNYDFAPLGPKPAPVAGSYFPVQIPVLQMVCSPMFEGEKDGEAELHFRLRYDRIADAVGSPGVIAAIAPYNVCEPDHYSWYYTAGRLPDDKFMTWDTFLQSINNGEMIAVAMSAEPSPKPPELGFRDDTFIGWGGGYPAVVPEGFMGDARSNTGHVIPANFTTHQVPSWPASRRHLCGGVQ